MRFSDLLAMSLNNLRRRRLRTALTVLGVIIGTASIVVMMSLGIGLKELSRELIGSYASLTAINVYGDNFWGGSDVSDPKYLTDERIRQFGRMEHVTCVYPLLEAEAILLQGKYSTWTTIIGAPQEYLAEIPLGQGELSPEGTKTLELIFGNQILQQFSDGKHSYWETGELPDVDLMGKPVFAVFDTDAYYQSRETGEDRPKPPKKYLLKTAGIVQGTQEDYNEYSYAVYARLDLLETELKRAFKKKPIPGQPTTKKGKALNYMVYSRCIVNVDEMENVTEVQKQISDLGYEANSNADWMEQQEQQSNIIQAVLGGIGAISLFVAAIGIANTMMMSIYERTKEIGVIKVLGCDMRDIRSMFLMEAGFIGFLGGIIGIAFSYAVSLAMNRFLNLAETMTGMSGDISRIPVWLAVLAVGFAVFVGMAAGFFPALRAMKLSPLAAIRNQ